MTTSEVSTWQTEALRVLLSADGPLTSGEVAERTGLTLNRALRALNPLRKHPRVSHAHSGGDFMWWLA